MNQSKLKWLTPISKLLKPRTPPIKLNLRIPPLKLTKLPKVSQLMMHQLMINKRSKERSESWLMLVKRISSSKTNQLKILMVSVKTIIPLMLKTILAPTLWLNLLLGRTFSPTSINYVKIDNFLKSKCAGILTRWKCHVRLSKCSLIRFVCLTKCASLRRVLTTTWKQKSST